MKIEFYDTITEMNSCNMALAKVSKEDLKKIFEDAGKVPKNDCLEEDDSYIFGEIQFMFSKDMSSLDEILVFPVYGDDEGGEVNGDFINAPDSFTSFGKEAREYLVK
ncbi:hypothetical protein bpr_II394 (plasmid) [Butyrivibrio proteoclasticus B316]|uniref:Uncharacterized protein n=1 Tax=Butyrivibrio proteoclasticus (strain ATCC 51982 / DSM 14932 / B316) TaxID=515622 RepID=E0S4J9_BUTPB|nr:hypothetical protein [Butyrivibrio proteoclasticus]ADL36331.1 hypothetical protein bpr_II394 [Butyrivibrio proteoclasticus B316]